MEGGEVEYWRIDEQQCGLQEEEEEEEEEKGIVSKTRWVLNAGLRLGKKVVITGIMVSSAPLVLPPLISICVVGFVVLVPAGVFLGSYACTEKLMSKLLPLEYHSQAVRNGNQFEEEEELYGRVSEGEFALFQEEMKMEGEERIELVRDNEEGSEYVDIKLGIGVDDDDEDLEEEVYEEDIGDEYLEGEVVDVKIDENLEDVGEYLEGEHQEKNEISIDEDLEEGYEEDIGEYLEEEEEEEEPMPEMNLEEEEVHSEFGENVTRTKGLDLVATSTENHEAEENFEHKSVTTLLGNLGSSSMKEFEEDHEEHLEKTSGFEEEEDKKDTPSSMVDNENPLIGTEAKVEITTVAVLVKETQFAPETEKQGNGNNASEQVSAGAPSSEVMVSEEKIWEQMSAIRGVLGYTAAPQSSIVDELKALFILTGVEPPSPFEDPSDLADVDEKLRLLMSIIGAK